MTTFPAGGSAPFGGEETILEQRTSIMAILSLVLSLVCFIPGLGVLGVIFAIAALIAISGSQGRLAGRGMAIAGLVLGLLFSGFWIALSVGATKAWQAAGSTVFAPMAQTMIDIDKGDFAAARKGISSKVEPDITDEEFIAFRKAVQEDLGSFQGMPTGFMSFIRSYAPLGTVIQKYQGQQNVLPMPGTFANGPALLLFQIDVDSSGAKPKNGSEMPPLISLRVATLGGKEYSLHQPPPGLVPSTPIRIGPKSPKFSPPPTAAPTPPPSSPEQPPKSPG